MSSLFVYTVETLLMAVLVALFVWLYWHDRQPRLGLWVGGWVFVLLHLCNSVAMAATPTPGFFAEFNTYATLIISGSSFLLSMSPFLASTRQRIIFLGIVVKTALLYWAALAAHLTQNWIYMTCLTLCMSGIALLIPRCPLPARLGLYALCLAPPALLWHWLPQHADYGIDFILFLLFASTGIVYRRFYRKWSPGVVLTSLSFAAWGLIFPVGDLLSAFKIGPGDDSAFWDLEKYAVAFGMILTLFEEKTEIASGVARRYQDLFEANLAGRYVVTLDRRLIECNSAFWRMYGFQSRQQALCCRLDDLDACPAERTAFLEILQTQGHVLDHELQQQRKDGSRFWVSERASLVRGEQGEARIEGTVIDISRRKEAEAKLQEEIAERKRAEEAATSASQAKSAFLATISHEIRTPMNGIIGMTNLVLDTALTSTQRDDLEVVKGSAEALLQVINDVLDFSKIEAGKLQLERIPFQLDQTLGDLVKLMMFRAQEKELRLSYSIAEGIPLALDGDPGRLRQVLLNLVGNAIKFTDSGHVSVAAELELLSESHVVVHFTVTDSGIGVPPDKRQSIFEAFTQAEDSTTRRFGGTGLGLAISSRLVRLMGGKIWVEDNPSASGSAFHFTARFKTSRVRPAVPEKTPTFALIGLKILLVEDNPVNQLVALRILERQGHSVSLARNGQEAVDALSSGLFNLVLMDLEMPVMDGLEATRTIRSVELKTGTHIPIVAMTANALKSDRERCIAAGMDGFIPKPVNANELLLAIEALSGPPPESTLSAGAGR